MKKYVTLFVISIENLKNLRYHTPQKKTFFSIICSKYKNVDKKKIFKEEESIEILKILDLINNVKKYQNI